MLEGRREAGRGTLTSDLAERRVEQSGELRRSARSRRFDVEEEACWVRSIERLSILRLREWDGLKSPDMTHPLFSSAFLGRLAPPLEPRTDPLLDAAFARFSTEHPLTTTCAKSRDAPQGE